ISDISCNEILSDNNISTNSDIENASNKLIAKPNLKKMLVGFGNTFAKGNHRENRKSEQIVNNFQSHLNTHGITKPIEKDNIPMQSTIDEMFQCAAKQNYHQKEPIESIVTLTRSCALLETCTDSEEMEEINNIDMSTIFDNEEEDIIDLDDKSETITTADGKKFKLNLPQNTDSLIENSLITILLDPQYKSMKQLNNWEHNKAVSLLQEKYNLLSVENELIKLFSIMFGSNERSTLVKNEVDRYLKIDQISTKTNPLNWWKDIQEKLSILASLARKYLAIPAISTPSKRLFSNASNLMTAKRTLLNAGLFERILFFQRNIGCLETIFEP
ncbi:27734_t:CDS:2, partial [Gigaspora margarita]